MIFRTHSGVRGLLAGAFLCLALSAAASAQVLQPVAGVTPKHKHRTHSSPAQQLQAASVPPASQAIADSTAAPVSLLDQPAQPAKIDLAGGQLSIHADNSSLIDIMHRLTADAGMTVDGLSNDRRVFGTYGPGDPQEVISDLLDGTGYNVVMLGRTDAGTPKQVTLTPRAGGVPNTPGGIRPQPMNQINQMSQDEDVDDEPVQSQPMQMISPPVENQQPMVPQQPGGVRTPQQMLQELQEMRQQQMQQMQQQQGQPQPMPPQQQ